MIKKIISINLILIAIFIGQYSFADQDIEIIGGNQMSTPKVAVINFANDPNQDNNNSISNVIANDLGITGEFNITKYDNIKNIDGDTKYIISGNVEKGNIISFTLENNNINNLLNNNTSSPLAQKITTHGTNLLTEDVSINPNNVRASAHTISNAVYKQLTDTQGVFNSKIAFITRTSLSHDKHHVGASIYKIIVSDYDGYNQHTITSSHKPLSSLAWSHSGKQIAYVSFESKKPVVYVQNLYSSKDTPPTRYVVADFSGSNSSPAFTPDDSQLTVTLSLDSNYVSQIYLINNAKFTKNSNAKRLVEDFGQIDTEAYVGDNNNLIFTSDRDGTPEIFMTKLQDDTPQRVTLSSQLGDYNSSAKLSHDGTKVTFVSRINGGLIAYIYDLNTKIAYPISSNAGMALDPSFAPNDKLVLFSGGGNNLYIANVTGTTETRLKNIKEDTIIDQMWANNF